MIILRLMTFIKMQSAPAPVVTSPSLNPFDEYETTPTPAVEPRNNPNQPEVNIYKAFFKIFLFE